VRVERAYESALRLYPADYRARFAGEMLTAFEEAVTDHHGAGTVASARFVLAELAALASGIGAEWLAKLTSDNAARGRCLPDCRMMRPAGVTCEEWAAGLGAIDAGFDATDMFRGGRHADPTAR
jgi:hypothetical protein